MLVKIRQLLRWFRERQHSNSVLQHSSPTFVREEDGVYPKLYDASLEDRRVLNADPLLVGADSILHINASSGANDGLQDHFQIRRESTEAGDRIVVDVNSQRAWSGLASSIQGIVLHGSSDQDVFYVDPSITLSSGVVIQGGEANGQVADSPRASDVVLFGPSSQRFTSSTFEISSQGVDVRFQGHHDLSKFQLVGIELIVDQSETAVRDLRIDGPSPWTLSDSSLNELERFNGADSDLLGNSDRQAAMLQLASSNTHFVFGSDLDRLQISVSNHSTASSLQLHVADAHFDTINRVDFALRSSDAISFQGDVQLPQILQAKAGVIDLRGSLDGISSRVHLQADLSIHLERSANLSTHGGQVSFDAANISIDGVIQSNGAGGIDLIAGEEGLLVVTGKLFATASSGEVGGRINLRGGSLQIIDQAQIDVSANGQAGSISIGGDFKGLPGAYPNSKEVFIGDQARIRADGLNRGHGGNVVVWSENKTTILGTHVLTARGGSLAGNGGLIETSSRIKLEIDDPVSLAAANGLGGTWIIDPKNIIIVADNSVLVDDQNNSYVKVGTILSALNNNTNVVLDTSDASRASGTGDGDITVGVNINASASTAGRLVFKADRDFILPLGVSISGNPNNTLGVEITATRNIIASGSFSNLKYLSAVATGSLSVSTIQANGVGDTSGNAVHLTGNSINVGGNITTAAADVLLTNTGNLKTVNLSGNISTLGGDFTVQGGGTVAVNGARVIDTNGGRVTMTDVASIDSTAAASTFRIDTSAASAGGNVALASIPNLANNLISLVVDTNATNGSGGNLQLGDVSLTAANSTLSINLNGVNDGVLTLNDQAAGDTVISFRGVLDLSGFDIVLADNAQIALTGGNLTVGDIQKLGALAGSNLSLSSTGNVSIQGAVNLGSGSLSVQIDSDNNTVGSSFTNGLAINAGSISITGGTTRDDTATINGTMTTQGGGITFSTLDTATLNANVSSGAALTFSNILSSVEIGALLTPGSRQITSVGTMDFTGAPTLSLTGADSTFVNLETTGSSGSVRFSAVSSVNSVSLTVDSQAGLSATGSVNLKVGALNALFGQSNAGSNSASFQSINAGSVSIQASGSSDQLTLNQSVTASSTSVTLQNATTTLGGNITTSNSNGNIVVNNVALLVRGPRLLRAQNGGDINLIGTTTIDGTGANPAELTINANADNAGNITVGRVVALNAGLNNLTITNTGSTSNGTVTLSDIRLVRSGVAPSQLNVNESLAPGAAPNPILNINGTIDLSEGQANVKGGSVDFGTSIVTPVSANSTLTILTNHTGTNDGGNIAFGEIVSQLNSPLFNSVVLNAGVADSSRTAGKISIANGNTHSIVVDGTAATQATVGIRIEGNLSVVDNPSKSLTLLAQGANSMAIDFSKATIQGYRTVSVDTSGPTTSIAAQNAGHVYLGNLNLSLASSSLTVDSRGNATNGITFVDDQDPANSTVVINVNGPADFTRTTLSLNKSTAITAGSNDLSINAVRATAGSTVSSLELSAERSVILLNAIDLPDSDITITIDSNNNNAVSNPFAGSIRGKSVLVEGSSNNDSATFSGAVTSVVGSVTFSNLSNLTLNNDVTAATSLNLNNITTSLSVGGGVDISAANSINLSTAPALVLTGLSGTTASISATGNGSSVTLRGVSVVNGTNNPNLTINAQKDVTLTDAVNINGGTLTVNFGKDNAGAANALVTDTIQAGALTVAGGTQANDLLSINANVTTSGNVTTTATDVTLKADIQTSGGRIQMSGGKLLVDGTAVNATRTLKTGGSTANVANAGDVDLSGMSEIDGVSAIANFVINADGSTQGGDVSLARVVANQAGGGINQLTITTAPTTGTVVQIADVRLVAKGSTPAALRINSSDTNAATVLANGTIDLSESAAGRSGGLVDMGSSILRPVSATSELRILTNNTSGSNTAGSNGGNITLGGVGSSNPSNYFDRVELNAGGGTNTNTKGAIRFLAASASTPVSVTVDGGTTDPNTVGIAIVGNINLATGASPQPLTLEALPAATGPANSRAIDLGRADFVGGYGNLTIRTSQNQSALNAGNVRLGDVVFGTTTVTSSLTIDTSGKVSSGGTNGVVTLEDLDSVATKATLQVNGSLTTTNATLQIKEDTDLRTTGSASTMNLGTIQSLAGAPTMSLLIASDRGANLNGPITATNANVSIQYGSSGSQNLTIAQPIIAQSITVTGNGVNDDVNINGTIQATTGNIQFSQLRNITLAGDLNTAGGSVTVTGSTSLRINGNATRTIKTADATTATGGAINLLGLANIDGASKPGTLILNSAGTSAAGAVSLANVVASNGGVNRIDVIAFVAGGTDGQVTINDVRLVADGATPAQFNINVGKIGVSTILADCTIDLSESALGRKAGTVDFGQAIIAPTSASSILTIRANQSNSSSGNDNSDGGRIIFGKIGTNGGAQFNTVTLDASAADPLDTDGTIDLSLSSTPSIIADGPAATASIVNISLAGDVLLPTDGSGLTLQTLQNANRTGAIDLSKASFVGNGNLSVDTSAGGTATTTGNVRLGDIDLTSAPSQLSINTQAATPANSGIVTLGDGDGTVSTTSIRVLGAINLSNSVVELTDNTLIESLGEGNTLSVGAVSRASGSTNVSLTLKSEADINASGAINLGVSPANGFVDFQVDTNNDSNNSLTIGGAVTAGAIRLSGSVLNNDTASVNGTLTAGTGGITITNFDSIQVNQNLSSQSSITVSQIATEVELVGGKSVNASGTIAMDSNVSLIKLTGAANSTVSFDASASGSVNLTNISSSAGIGLTIGANGSVKAGTIDIGAGDLQVNFSRTNIPASADLSTISADAVVVNGAGRPTDSIFLRGTVTSTSASLNNGGNITVFGDILTKGGALTISGNQLVFDGAAVHNLNTNLNGVSTGGNIDLSSLTSIDAKPGVTGLVINTQGTSGSGSVSLSPVVATQGGLNQLQIFTSAVNGTDGQVTLKDVRLVNKLGVQSRLDVNANDVTPTTILVQGSINLSESATGLAGGIVDFGDALLSPISSTGSLTITVASTNTQPGVDGSSGGTVRFGGTASSGPSLYNSILIDTSAADPAEQQGSLSFGSNTNKTITVDGTPTNQATVGLKLVGQVLLPQSSNLTLQTRPGTNGNTQAIDLSQAKFLGNGNLRLDTSSSGTSGNVLLGDILLTTGASSLTVVTQGSSVSTSGVLQLNDSDGSTTLTEIQVLGAIDLSQSRILLQDNALIQTLGNSGSLQLGTINTNASRDLTLTSSSSLALSGPIDLQGGSLSLTVDQDDNQTSSLDINGTINAGSLTIAGSPTTVDQLTINQNVTSTVGSVNISQFNSVIVGATLQSNTNLSIANVANKISLGSLARVLAKGSIQLNSNVNQIELSGAINTNTVIDTTGLSASVSLAPIVDIGNQVTLTIGSDGGVSLSPVNASQTNVVVQFSRNASLTNQSVTLGTNTARGFSVQGGSKPSDLVTVQGVQQLGTSGLTLSNIGNTVWNADISSAGAVNVTNVSGKVQVADNVDVDGVGGVGIVSGVSVIEFLGSAGSSSRIKSTGDGGNVNLAAVQSANGVNLSIASDNNVSVSSIQNGPTGTVDIQVDANNNSSTSATLTSGAIQSGSIRAQGSVAKDDTANLNGLWTSTSNDIQLLNWRNVNVNSGLQSATGISLSDVSNQINLNSPTPIIANAGNVSLQSGVNQVNLTTNGNYVVTALQGSVSSSSIVGSGNATNLQINADQSIQLQSTNQLGSLQLQAGRNNSPVGSINASSTLRANSIQLDAATGIGTSNSLSTATTNIAANNRLSGNIAVGNSSATQTSLNLTNLGNGSIQFSQTGGGAVSIANALTQASNAPVLDGVNISITNTGANIVVDSLGSGVQAGNLGSIRLQTLNSGDIRINRPLTASTGQIIVQSAGQVIGTGLSTANAITLNANSIVGSLATRTTSLGVTAATGSINVSNNSSTTATASLATANGGITFSHTGSDLIVGQASALGSSAGAINLSSANGNLTIQGAINNQGTQANSDIVLSATQNIVMGSLARVQTQSSTALIRMLADRQFVMQPGAVIVAGASDAATEARLTQIPIPLFATPVFNSAGVNVDGEGNTQLQIRIGSPGNAVFDKRFQVTIDWGDGSTSVLPNSLLVSGQNRIDANGATFLVGHKYLINPNVDPTAPIPVSVTAKADQSDRIRIFENNRPSPQLSTTNNLALLVPASGLFTLRFELAEIPTVVRITAPPAQIIDAIQLVANASSKPNDFITSASEAVAKKERSYTICIVTPKNDSGAVEMSEPVSITEDELNDLSTLFSKLGDNRYRIFVTYENGIEVLLRDFYLKNGIPAEIDDSFGQEELIQNNSDQDEAASIPEQAEPVSNPASTNESVSESTATESLLQSLSAALGWRSFKKAARRFRSAG